MRGVAQFLIIRAALSTGNYNIMKKTMPSITVQADAIRSWGHQFFDFGDRLSRRHWPIQPAAGLDIYSFNCGGFFVL